MENHTRDLASSIANVDLLSLRSPVGIAVLIALNGIPLMSNAQSQSDRQAEPLAAVIVTASRRQQSAEEVPYSLSVVSPALIANTGVTDLGDLARQVPGVSMIDAPRRTGSVFPIIRGLNASPGAADFRTFEQAPVGTYIGDSPIDGYFQLDDIERVEILRGPQGTLYGAGSLGGALRIIPNAPELGSFESNVEARGGMVEHASEASYAAAAMINIPVGENVALRASGNYEHLAGFIDIGGIFDLDSNGAPVLADPSDPIDSPAIVNTKTDANFQDTFTGRVSLLWQPSDNFTAQFSYMYSDLDGDGSPVFNSEFPGGPFVGDPRVNFPSGGQNRTFAAIDLPFTRKTDLASLDLSYDAGFATLSSTTSYTTTDGSNSVDYSFALYKFPQYLGYYAGNPTNPRFIMPGAYSDTAHTFTQELRLVSNSDPGKVIDYVVGLFYQKQSRNGLWIVTAPGSSERAALQGCTAPYFVGASFPNCMPMTGAGDLIIDQNDQQDFEGKSLYGEITWHVTDRMHLTAGARHFKQDFEDRQSLDLFAFGIFTPADAIKTTDSDTTWKLNASYEYATDQHVYALWSQGFRRGGANAVPLEGPFADNPDLRTYDPDSVDNFEVGLKGHFSNGVSYAFDVFYIVWDKPQVGGITPTTNFAVWNANEAVSQGFEFEFNTPLGLSGLSLMLGGAYADAAFSEDYLIPSTFGDIVGRDGEQLPLSPKVSAAATINYERVFTGDNQLTVSLNDTYRSDMTLSTFPVLSTPPAEAEKMNIVNASVTFGHDVWRTGVYVTNLTNERVILSPGIPDPASNNLTFNSTISRPREIFLRLSYSF